MRSVQALALVLSALVVSTGADLGVSRKLLQEINAGTPSTITVSADNPRVDAITITLAIPYPQNAFFCNVTGDPRIPQEGPFPLTVRVPVGVESTVVFANITGPIPGSTCQTSSVVQQPGSSVVQQPGGSMQQLVNSVVQQQAGATVVQQQYAASVNQQGDSMGMNCVSDPTSIVQQPGATVVQQPTDAGTVTVIQQPTSVVQQPDKPPTTVVQQPSPPTTVVQQPSPPTTVVQQPSPPTTVVQQPTPPTTVEQPESPPTTVEQPESPPTTVEQPESPPTTVEQPESPPTTVEQPESPPTTVEQPESPPTSVEQQESPPTSIVQSGRHLLQAGTIEWISNNGSTGQPQLTVLDTTEGVPNISFKPTAPGQTAQFNGALQVAITTTNDGFGTPYIPYQVDAKLSPQCAVQVNFVSF